MDDRELIERWVVGEASEAEAEALRARLAAEPALLRELFASAERECELYELFAPAPALAGAADAPRATRSWARRTREPLRRWLVPLAAAAALVAALLLTVSQLRQHQAESRALDAPALAARPGPDAEPRPVAPAAAAPASRPSPAGPVSPKPEVSGPEAPLLARADPAPRAIETGGSAPDPAPAPTAHAGHPNAAPAAAATHLATVQIERRDGELKDEAGNTTMRYALRAPRQGDAQARLGLVLCFHGAGGDERWLADPMVEALRANGVAAEFVVASLKSRGKDWSAEDEPRVLSFIEWAEKSYPIDPRRLVIQGVSNGGWFVDFFGSRHQDLVAGVVTLCSGWGFDLKKHADAAATAPEFYLVHGVDDKDVNVRSSRASVATLRGLGYRFVYREYAGLGHNVYDDERTRRDFAAWLERLRHKTMPLADDDRKELAAFARGDEADRLVQTSAGADALLRIGGIQAERVLVRCLRSRSAAARAAAATLLARTGCSPGVGGLLALLLDDKDPAVRRAAASTLVQASDWNDQEALIAVCRFAGSKARDRDERLALAERLERSLAFRSMPGPDNQLIYELFVHLLEDDDLAVRGAAIAALAGATARSDPERFGYQPEAPASARRDAVMRWRKWYVELFTPPPPDEKERR